MDNRLSGFVTQIRFGAADSMVDVQLVGGDILRADISNESVRYLGLAKGTKVVALVKSPWVTIDIASFAHSGRNRLDGTVRKLAVGAREADLTVMLKGGSVISTAVDNERVQALSLRVGEAVIVVIKAAHVALLLPAN